MRDSILEKAKAIAIKAHAGQFRKWSNPPQPYIVHPERVANRIASLKDVTEVDIAAGYLHDVVEDCGAYWANVIQQDCGQEVLDLVMELTFETEGPEWAGRPRAEKNVIRYEHMRKMTLRAKRAKMADREDNLNDMKNAPHRLIHKTVDESWVLLDICKEADSDMAAILKEAIVRLEKSK